MCGVYAATSSAVPTASRPLPNTKIKWNEYREQQQPQYPNTSRVRTLPRHRANKVMAVFLGTCYRAGAASLYKDRAYARMFGNSSHESPKVTYGLWMVCDFLLVGFTVYSPDLVFEKMHLQ
jgi:hypothetical protein